MRLPAPRLPGVPKKPTLAVAATAAVLALLAWSFLVMLICSALWRAFGWLRPVGFREALELGALSLLAFAFWRATARG
jgi:hypothetical protein